MKADSALILADCARAATSATAHIVSQILS